MMARPIGTPAATTNIMLYVSEDWVLKQNRHRYVFTDALLPKIRQLSDKAHGSFKLYNNFHAALRRGLYNVSIFYEKRAIDIDKPLRDDIAVSIRPRIIVGEGEDSYEKTDPARSSAEGGQRGRA